MSRDFERNSADRGGFVSVIGEVYAAAENPDHWPAVLDRIGDLIEARGAFLVATYANADLKDVHAFAGIGPAALVEYQAHYNSVNAWARPMDAMFGLGRVGYSHLAVPDAHLKKTEYYAGWLRPNGLAYGIGVTIPQPGQPPALLTFVRPPERGPFEANAGRVLEALMPHLQRGLRLHFELAGLRTAAAGLETAIDMFDRAVFGVDPAGRVLFCNHTARGLVTASDGLRIKANQLVADSPKQNAELQFLLAQAAAHATGFGANGAILIDRRSGKPPLRLILMPFARNLIAGIPGLVTLVFVYDPARGPSDRAAVLQSVFRLSPTESRLTTMLAAGHELTAAADQLKMMVQTARFHLKSIFRKTGVRRQSDLVRLVLSLPGVISHLD